MNIHEARDWFDEEIRMLRSAPHLSKTRRKRLEAYEQAEEAFKIAEASMIRPHWYGKPKEINDE